jgi:branched-chain amino acid transport system ATP-binding protein
MLLEVSKLSKRFGGVRAVDDVTWSMDAGETRCIIGPNGAGKSTFFQLLAGRIRPDAGTIRLSGDDITHHHPFERARLGIAVKPQTLGVFNELTVEHNLRVCLQRKLGSAAIASRIEELLGSLGLASKKYFLAKELSHGEKQWLGLGMTMATFPRLILLDEPTAGMSDEETVRTAELIGSMAAAGTSVLVVEHDMAFVRALSVETTVFHEGRIFMSGSLAEIQQNEDVRRLYLGQRGAKKLQPARNG